MVRIVWCVCSAYSLNSDSSLSYNCYTVRTGDVKVLKSRWNFVKTKTTTPGNNIYTLLITFIAFSSFISSKFHFPYKLLLRLGLLCFDVQILAFLTSWDINTTGRFTGDVAVHMWKIDDSKCKVISFIVDADMQRWVVVTKFDPCVVATHFRGWCGSVL